jgi:hypothetical protein
VPGNTIHKPVRILADLNETFQAAMCYVILSRIVCIGQLLLLAFNPSKIYCNEEAKAEALSIKGRALNLQFNRWNQNQCNTFKISSLNAQSLSKHFADLKDDQFLQQSDILCVNETWLLSDLDKDLEGYTSYYLNKRSKGIALFTKIVPQNVYKLHTETMSLIVAQYKLFDLLSVYRYSESTQIEEFTRQVLDNVDLTKTTIILGDINIDLFKHENNTFSREMKNLGFVQLVKQATHLSGGLLDHIYIYIPLGGHCELFKIHPLYYSDHDAVCCILEFPC